MNVAVIQHRRKRRCPVSATGRHPLGGSGYRPGSRCRLRGLERPLQALVSVAELKRLDQQLDVALSLLRASEERTRAAAAVSDRVIGQLQLNYAQLESIADTLRRTVSIQRETIACLQHRDRLTA